jgi:hypothetical protein
VAHDDQVKGAASQRKGPQIALRRFVYVGVAARLVGDVHADDASYATGQSVLEHATAAAACVQH